MRNAYIVLRKLYGLALFLLLSFSANAQPSESFFCQQRLQSDSQSVQIFLSDLRTHLEHENEDAIPYYILGLDEDLKAFSKKIKAITHHQTLYYDELVGFSHSDHPLKNKLLKNVPLQDKYNSVEEWMPVFEKTIRNWANAAPGEKTIYFNLNLFDFNNFKNFVKPLKKNPNNAKEPKAWTNFTNAEMKFLLSDKKVFNAIRWYKDGRALGETEVKNTFIDLAPQLFD